MTVNSAPQQTIASFEFSSADGFGSAKTVFNGQIETPIAVVDKYINIDQHTAPSSTTNKLYNVGGTLYWNGAVVDTGAGDITAVNITTSSQGGLTGGANFSSGDASFTLALAGSIPGSRTFEDDIVIQGDLTVQGATTSLEVATLNVEDKNITLNYGSGDTSASANGSGITIQDAVSQGNDASLTWRASDDKFIFSHPLRMFGQFELPDNIKLVAGDSNDLEIYHDGSNSYIRDLGTGNLRIDATDFYVRNSAGTQLKIGAVDNGAVNLYYAGSKKLETTNTGVTVTGYLATNTSGGLFLPDSAKILVGSSNDLEIFHDGSNSRIYNATGSLLLRNNDLYIQSTDGTTNSARFNSTTGVTLFRAGSPKLETTSTGIDVSGITVTDGIDTSSHIYIDNDRDINFRKADGTTDGTFLTRAGGNAMRFKYGGNAFIFDSIDNKNWRIYNSSGNGIFEVIPTSNATSSSTRVYGRLQIGTTTVIDNSRNLVNIESIKLNDSKIAYYGTDNDFQIQHTGTYGSIRNYTGTLYITADGTDADIVIQNDDGSGGLATYMYFDGGNTNIKFEKDVYLLDNVDLYLGNSGDLQLLHDTANSHINNYNGDFYITQRADDKDIIFRTDDGSGGFTPYLTLDGSTAESTL